MPFHSTGPHFCPRCPEVRNRRGERVGVRLDLIESNYSGCGVDIACCPQCEKRYQISYCVRSIDELLD
jgi:hypothetical protein